MRSIYCSLFDLQEDMCDEGQDDRGLFIESELTIQHAERIRVGGKVAGCNDCPDWEGSCTSGRSPWWLLW